MKQFQITYTNADTFLKELLTLKERSETNKETNFLFQIYSTILEEEPIHILCQILEQVFPDAPYMGCSTSGNITDCQLASEIVIICTIFEYADTKVKILQYDTDSSPVTEITKSIIEETRQNQWVNAIELYCTIPENSTTQFCAGLTDIRPDIKIFGGISCSEDITSSDSIVFSKMVVTR